MPRPLPSGPILVDAAFVLGLLFGEEPATRFTAVLGRASIVDVNLGEVFTQIDQRVPTAAEDISRVLDAQGLEVIPVGSTAAARFPMLKVVDLNQRVSQWAKGVPEKQVKTLSWGDMACLAVAIDRQWPVLTGEDYWTSLGLALQIEDYRDPELLPDEPGHSPAPSSQKSW
jgi:PIN domain nuclease of toxin-antitoxin system